MSSKPTTPAKHKGIAGLPALHFVGGGPLVDKRLPVPIDLREVCRVCGNRCDMGSSGEAGVCATCGNKPEKP